MEYQYKNITQVLKAAVLPVLLCVLLPFAAHAADLVNNVNTAAGSLVKDTTQTITRDIANATKAVAGADFIANAGVNGVQAAANTNNFYVEGPSGTAGRYVDVFDKSIFIPLKTDMEANAFVQNVDVSQARVDLVRPKYIIGSVDFAAGLSIANGSMPVNMRGTVMSSTVSNVADIPKVRIDTSGVAGMSNFMANRIYTRSMAVNMMRKDCRLINYPDGSSETVCAPDTTWVETPTKRWTYHLTARGISDADGAQVMMTKLTTPTVLAKQPNVDLNNIGNWTTDFMPATAPPAYTPPQTRNCAGHANGEQWWVDTDMGTTAMSCPAGQITNPADPYRQTWTNQQEYQCYDGKVQNGAYPMTPTREKPSSRTTVGSCLVVASGQCSATYMGQAWSSLNNAPALCSAGTTANFTATANGWAWTCAGQNGGTDVSCSTKQPYHWTVDGWGGWSACENGSQHRERGVYCRDQNENVFPGDWTTACDYSQYPGWQEFQGCTAPPPPPPAPPTTMPCDGSVAGQQACPTNACFFWVSGVGPSNTYDLNNAKTKIGDDVTWMAGGLGYGFSIAGANPVGPGYYPDSSVPFSKANNGTFDGAAIGSKTHIVVKGKTGIVLADLHGPLTIANIALTNRDYYATNSDDMIHYWKKVWQNEDWSQAGPLFQQFTPATRIYTKKSDELFRWALGSVNVTCDP